MTAIADVSAKPFADLLSLAGRRAVVTGGARGLGRAIAARLAEAGASVLVGDRDAEGATAAAKAIASETGAETIGCHLDVTDSASVASCAALANDEFGGLDIWVNNAGIFPTSPATEMSDEAWDAVIDVNLRGAFIGCREAARTMIAAGKGGVIVNIASTAGLRGTGPGVAHYVASKHGVTGLTKQLAIEFGPHGIRVPGDCAEHYRHRGSRRLRRRCPLARAARPCPSSACSAVSACPTTLPGWRCSVRPTCRST